MGGKEENNQRNSGKKWTKLLEEIKVLKNALLWRKFANICKKKKKPT